VVIGTSCGSVPKTSYYTLRLPAAPPAVDPKTSFSLGVEHFRAAEVLRDDRIVFYKSPTELDFYQYHRWSADPAGMLTERVARWLSQTGLFAEVRTLPTREAVDYVLRGRLLNFEEVDDEGPGKGRVAFGLALVRSRDHRVVWSFERQAEHSVEGQGMPGVVDALNASTEDLLGQALPGLAQQVERDFSESRERPQ
jgi:ABC-type uncharacterized transport system auxiliary subunit